MQSFLGVSIRNKGQDDGLADAAGQHEVGNDDTFLGDEIIMRIVDNSALPRETA